MKRILLSIIATITFFAQTTVFADAKSDFNNAQVNIKFFDRTMYYPEMTEENPVYVQVTIANNGTDTIRFKLADDRMFSMDFTAYTIRNSTLPVTEKLTEKRSTNQTVYFREISVEPGESYSFVENVKDYLKFSEPSIYYLEMNFYPELYKSKFISKISNRLSLEVRPAPSAASSSLLPVETKTASILKQQEISPDKVVEQTINARQKSLWDQYFLYMDIEEMMLRAPDVNRKYRMANPAERTRMLESYKADLMQTKIDHDIVAIPYKYVIENTSYNATDGSVSVLEWFKYPTYSEKKRYIYKVRQRDGIWQIYNFTVTNLGTE